MWSGILIQRCACVVQEVLPVGETCRLALWVSCGGSMCVFQHQLWLWGEVWVLCMTVRVTHGLPGLIHFSDAQVLQGDDATGLLILCKHRAFKPKIGHFNTQAVRHTRHQKQTEQHHRLANQTPDQRDRVSQHMKALTDKTSRRLKESLSLDRREVKNAVELKDICAEHRLDKECLLLAMTLWLKV